MQRVQTAHGGSGGRPPVHRSRSHGRPRHPCGGVGAGSRGPAGRGASSASDEHPGCPSARRGTPSSTTGCRWCSDSSSTSWPDGSFVERGVNVLAFGLPGTGKTHAMCAIGHRLVESGRSVMFTPAYRLVQDMLAAKRDLDLPRMLRKLVQPSRNLLPAIRRPEATYPRRSSRSPEVLFTLSRPPRYERRSLGITSRTSSSHDGMGRIGPFRQP